MFGGDPFRNIRQQVKAPVQSMRTFQIDQPLSSHFRRATCTEVECRNRAAGWRMGFDLSDPERLAAARWIRDHSGRRYTHEIIGGKVIFTFPSGQDCFKTHRVPLEREPFYVVRGGDWRGNPEKIYFQHRSADSFIDQWESDLDRLNTIRERS